MGFPLSSGGTTAANSQYDLIWTPLRTSQPFAPRTRGPSMPVAKGGSASLSVTSTRVGRHATSPREEVHADERPVGTRSRRCGPQLRRRAAVSSSSCVGSERLHRASRKTGLLQLQSSQLGSLH